MDFERWAEALGKVESNHNPRAWGDDGLAVGRWQMHPAFYHDWAPRDIEVRASWDTAFRAALRNFYIHFQGQDPLRVAMMFHLGVVAVKTGQWDADYAKRFNDAAA